MCSRYVLELVSGAEAVVSSWTVWKQRMGFRSYPRVAQEDVQVCVVLKEQGKG